MRPSAQVHTTLFLIVLTFMYVSARAAADQHRADVVDPMIADLGLTIAARDRYRACLTPG